jgi:hypothetical protein
MLPGQMLLRSDPPATATDVAVALVLVMAAATLVVHAVQPIIIINAIIRASMEALRLLISVTQYGFGSN